MSEMTPEEKKKMEEGMKELVTEEESKSKITFLNVAFIPAFTESGKPKLIVGVQAKDGGIQTINEFRSDDAIWLLNTLTNPRVKNIVNLERRKKK